MEYMNTVMTWQTNSTSSEATEQLAETLGRRLRGGEVIELVSDLGGGKTTFTRGLVRGTGSTAKVASPTFTLSREYQAPKFIVAHFDFYRLSEGGIVADELAEFIGDPGYVCVVEWGDIVDDVLPEQRLTVRIERTHASENVRRITYGYPAELKYLVEDAA
jgi:tRNA threonylcarbamoyladenosine biosynthesis protein TsaE